MGNKITNEIVSQTSLSDSIEKLSEALSLVDRAIALNRSENYGNPLELLHAIRSACGPLVLEAKALEMAQAKRRG